jgi:hypothetical protein
VVVKSYFTQKFVLAVFPRRIIRIPPPPAKSGDDDWTKQAATTTAEAIFSQQ